MVLAALAFLLAQASLPGAFGTPAVAQSTSFSRIDVAGNQRIDADSIRVFSGLQPGQRLSPAQLNAGLQRLFDTGLFEDVDFSVSAGRLLITVVENPTINRINFEGNRSIDDEQLAAVIALQPRRAYSRSVAEADAQTIISAYGQTGRFGAEVTPVIIRLPDNRVDLVFEIFEGRVTEVQRISFVGNQRYSDRRLRRAIETRQAGLFSTFFRNDTYDRDRIELDRQQLREFYLERGYVDFEVRAATAELARERNAFFVTFNISEGEQYSFGEATVTTSAPGLNTDDFQDLIDLRPGQVYKASRVERVIERLTFLAGQQGFAFVEVAPRISKDDDNRIIDIEFELLEGPRVFVERIDIIGNTQTLDRVLRRQFRVVEGDAFNAREVRNAEGRIRALNYFGGVDVDVREGSSADRAVVSVEVQEAPTGSVSFGAAFSPDRGVTGTFSITERNFLGRGQRLSLSASAGAEISDYSIDFTEPALFDQDLLAGISIYAREQERDESSIITRNIGIVPRIGFPVSENGRLTLRYRLSSDDVENTDPDSTSPVLLAEEGERITSAIGFTYQLDKRNSPVDPSAGFIFSFDQDFAGLGGDARYSRSVARARAFQSFFDEELIFSAEVEGGALLMFDGTSRIDDRFFLGGDRLRGFTFGGLGPRDKCSSCAGPGNANSIDDSLGGNFFAVARLEATFPIGLPEEYGIFGGVFADAGSVWGLDDGIPNGASGRIDDSAKLRSSVGASLFWSTPIGPLRLNYAFPLQTVDGDEEETVRLTIDTRF